MVSAWYPPQIRSAEERLRYYAAVFDTVEVDSTFYCLPAAKVSALWAERTPPGFTFHVKAFALMTRHPVRLEQLPLALRGEYASSADSSGRIARVPSELEAQVFDLYRQGLAPLRNDGKLGAVLLQFPPYLRATRQAREYIEKAVDRLTPDQVAVEFRHASWVDETEREQTFSFLSALGAAFVCVDEPRIAQANVLPPIIACTTPHLAYVRFHGRNASTWNARVASAAERFRYLYTQEELAEWVGPLRSLSEQAQVTYAMFNNCYADYAPRNAVQLLSLLGQANE